MNIDVTVQAKYSFTSTVSVIEKIPPVISDPTLSVTNLDIDGFTLTYVKATDNKPDSELIYKYYEGDPALLDSVSTIETQQLRQQNTGADAAQFVVPATEGDFVAGNILLEDADGNKVIYNAFSVLIPERSVESVDIIESDFTLNEGGQETFDFSVDVVAFEGADPTVTVTSSDPTIVAVTELTQTTFRSTLVTPLSEQDAVTITAVSNFDNSQFDVITATCIPHTINEAQESVTFEFTTA